MEKFEVVRELDNATDVANTYKTAYAGEPWYEVSICPRECDKKVLSTDEFSPCEVGRECEFGFTPTEEAYKIAELVEEFEKFDKENTAWYLEFKDDQLALAALMQKVTPEQLVAEKYTTNPEMLGWLQRELGETAVICWLDEIFADTNVRKSGNLANLKPALMVMQAVLGEPESRIAYRSINQRLLGKTKSAFGEQAKFYEPTEDKSGRTVVVLDIERQI